MNYQNQNPYQTFSHISPVMADRASDDLRASFLQRTYLHLLGAILAFAGITALILNVFNTQLETIVPRVFGGWMWLAVLGGFMLVSYIAERWAHSNTSQAMQYLGLGVYVVAEALFFVPLLWIAQNYCQDPDLITAAGVVTAVVFGGLTLVVLVTKADFSFLKWGLMAGGFIAAGLIIASIGTGIFSLGLWFSVGMVVLAAGAILYNTSNMLHHYRTDQHVAASLSLFASVALLFWYVLQIFISMDE